MEPRELEQMLKDHQLWLRSGEKEGKRAVFRDSLGAISVLAGANLERADLNGANFTATDLTDTNFQRAELRRVSFHDATLRRTNFREADLQNANLEEAKSLLSTQLAGADVAGAKLPHAIAEFEGLKPIAEATSNAQKLFIAILAGCVYTWLTIGTTTDAALLTNSASSPLPVIGTALPIVGFYLVAPIILAAIYFYFHLNMQRLWEGLADLPAVFPDGRPLDKVADPWLLNGLVRAHVFRLRSERPPLSRMQEWLSIVLAWWVVPITLFVLWARFLARHDWLGTGLHIFSLTVAIGFGWMSYRLARATLRGASRRPLVWAQAWKDLRTYKRSSWAFWVCVFGVIFYVISASAIEGVRPNYQIGEEPNLGKYSLRRLVPRGLEAIGFSPFANFLEEDISTKPSNWSGDIKEYPSVKPARLRAANIQYANAAGAFLVNADMRDAHASHAELGEANLWHANLVGADLSSATLRYADLSEANLNGALLSKANLDGAKASGAHLSHADLVGALLADADLSSADLTSAHLSERISEETPAPGEDSPVMERANLSRDDLSDANLTNANLQGAILRKANCSRTNFSNANLSRADLSGAIFSGAIFSDADLSGANLSGARLSGCHLSNAKLSNASLDGAYLDGAALTTVEGLTQNQLEKAIIDGQIPPRTEY